MVNPTTQKLYDQMWWQEREDKTVDVWLGCRFRSFYVPHTVFSPNSPDLSVSSSVAQRGIYPVKDLEVLDVGTGCGVLAVAAALGGAKRVVATDVNPEALRATCVNAEKHEVADKIKVKESDLFDRIYHEKFDVIIANLPIVDTMIGWDYVALCLCDPDYRLRARLLREGHQHLKPGGRICFCFANLQSGNTNDPYADFRRLEQLINFYGYKIAEKTLTDACGTIWVSYVLVPTRSIWQKVRSRLSWRFKVLERLRDHRVKWQKKIDWNRKIRPYCISRCNEEKWAGANYEITRRISRLTHLIKLLE